VPRLTGGATMPEMAKHGQPEPQERRTWWIVGITALVLLAIAVPLAAALLQPADDAPPAAAPVFEPPPPPETTQAEAAPAHPTSGKELFMENCGGCHTLAAAGTQGAGGPNLDKLRPGRRRVLAAIERGGSGYGVMPERLVEGKDAQRVARFVASSVKR
jgi:mono/diheme cytochrome c family protein